MDITADFGSAIPGSNPGEGTNDESFAFMEGKWYHTLRIVCFWAKNRSLKGED